VLALPPLSVLSVEFVSGLGGQSTSDGGHEVLLDGEDPPPPPPYPFPPP
jgi:hypothetical protein